MATAQTARNARAAAETTIVNADAAAIADAEQTDTAVQGSRNFTIGGAVGSEEPSGDDLEAPSPELDLRRSGDGLAAPPPYGICRPASPSSLFRT